MGLSADKVDSDLKQTMYKKLGIKTKRDNKEEEDGYEFEKVETKKRVKRIIADEG